jgi:hypothetical protein
VQQIIGHVYTVSSCVGMYFFRNETGTALRPFSTRTPALILKMLYVLGASSVHYRLWSRNGFSVPATLLRGHGMDSLYFDAIWTLGYQLWQYAVSTVDSSAGYIAMLLLLERLIDVLLSLRAYALTLTRSARASVLVTLSLSTWVWCMPSACFREAMQPTGASI